MRKHIVAVALLGAGVGCRKSRSGWMLEMPRSETANMRRAATLLVGQLTCSVSSSSGHALMTDNDVRI